MRKVLKNGILLLLVLVLTAGTSQAAYADTTTAMQAAAAAISSSEIELNWNSVDGARSYVIYRSNAREGGYQKLKTVSAATLSYRDSKISTAVNYYYKIIPVSGATGEEMTAVQVILKAKAPAKTSIEKVSVKSPTKITLTWKASAGSSGYEIYRSFNKNSGYGLIANIEGKNNVSYTDNEVVPGKNYYYKLRPVAQIAGTTGTGSYSEITQGRTIAKTTITSITSVSSTKMQIAWKKSGGAKSYEIYRSTKSDGGFKRIATVGANRRKYADMTVKSGKKYFYKVVSVGSVNGAKITSGYSKAAGFRALQQVKISSVKTTGNDDLKVRWKKVTGATEYKVYRAASQFGTYKKVATVPAKGTSTMTYIDKKAVSGKTYFYKVQAYAADTGLITSGSGNLSDAVGVSTAYAIMGRSTVTVDQMVAFYKASGRSFPSSVYQDKGAKNIKQFCKIVLDESEKEGIKAEVIFAQNCLETGYLQFGGQVSASQCNFAGLGATDDGAAGATFENVKIGIRAQVQHLKGYASKDSLNGKCVDPRFMYLASKRGCAAHVQDLGNGNWATDPNYAFKLMTMIRSMKSY